MKSYHLYHLESVQFGDVSLAYLWKVIEASKDVDEAVSEKQVF